MRVTVLHGAMITSVREPVAQIVSKSQIHQEVEGLQQRVDHWTAVHEQDLQAEKEAETWLQSARPGLEARGVGIQRLQKVRNWLPKVGHVATFCTFPFLGLGAVMASPILLAVGLVGAATVGASILGIEALKRKLPERLDAYNSDVDRFNRRSAELDGLREETRRSGHTLADARARCDEKVALEHQVVDETSKMVEAATRTRPDAIEESADEVVIGSIRLPRLTLDR